MKYVCEEYCEAEKNSRRCCITCSRKDECEYVCIEVERGNKHCEHAREEDEEK